MPQCNPFHAPSRRGEQQRSEGQGEQNTHEGVKRESEKQDEGGGGTKQAKERGKEQGMKRRGEETKEGRGERRKQRRGGKQKLRSISQ